jgi:AraC-like DNA-binding protein
MIDIMHMDEICSRPEHSGRLKNGVECRALAASRKFSQNRSKLEVLDGTSAGTRTTHPRMQLDATARVGRALTYMLQNLDKPLQVSTLAALANISSSHFFALFKQMTGSPPLDYFTQLRMHQACRLLDSSTARVKEVAAALGYDDPFYFSRVFKAVHNVPPSRYRAAQANLARVARRPRGFLPAEDGSPVNSAVVQMPL